LEVRARGDLWGFLGGGQGVAPLDAQAVGTEAPALHGFCSGADGDALFEVQRASILQVVFALVERDGESQVPTLGGQAEEAQGIVACIQGSRVRSQMGNVETLGVPSCSSLVKTRYGTFRESSSEKRGVL